jgi:hypothetical protein
LLLSGLFYNGEPILFSPRRGYSFSLPLITPYIISPSRARKPIEYPTLYVGFRKNLFLGKIVNFLTIDAYSTNRFKSPTTGIAGGLKDVNRSKRLKTRGHLKGGGHLPEEGYLIDSSIFSFLLFDVFANRYLVSAYRRNMVPSCPNWNPCYMIFAFPLRIA